LSPALGGAIGLMLAAAVCLPRNIAKNVT
jgi:hypothetical protein